MATDRAFQDDVKDIKHVVAVRYSEDVGGGMPKNMPGQMRQWWSAGFFKPDQLVAPSAEIKLFRE